jgi:hypothetical protein
MHAHRQTQDFGPREHEVPVGGVVLDQLMVAGCGGIDHTRLEVRISDQRGHHLTVGDIAEHRAAAGAGEHECRILQLHPEAGSLGVAFHRMAHHQPLEDGDIRGIPLIPKRDGDRCPRQEERQIAHAEATLGHAAIEQHQGGFRDPVQLPVDLERQQFDRGIERGALAGDRGDGDTHAHQPPALA